MYVRIMMPKKRLSSGIVVVLYDEGYRCASTSRLWPLLCGRGVCGDAALARLAQLCRGVAEDGARPVGLQLFQSLLLVEFPQAVDERVHLAGDDLVEVEVFFAAAF